MTWAPAVKRDGMYGTALAARSGQGLGGKQWAWASRAPAVVTVPAASYCPTATGSHDKVTVRCLRTLFRSGFLGRELSISLGLYFLTYLLIQFISSLETGFLFCSFISDL